MRVWFARLFALLALLGAAAAIYFAVTSVKETHAVTVDEAQSAMTRLTAANRTVAGRLQALRPGTSPRQAQDAARAAADLSKTLGDDVDGGGDLADRLDEVLQAELTYLDAIGSTLNNPRSELRPKIQERGIALREALQNIPGGDSSVVKGGSALVTYSIARVAD